MAALRANAGLNSSSDELQAQTRIAGMRSTLEQYQAQMASAKAQLAVLTGVQPEAIAAPPAELAEQPVSLKNIDYQSIPLVLAAENLRQSAQSGVEKTKAQYWPTLSIQGGKTRYQTSDRSYWDDQLQLNVNAPLYQGGAVSAQVQQAEGQQKISASQVEQAKLDVLQRASVAYANWTGARGREEAGLAQSESAHKTRDVYQNEYKLGKRSLNDLLTVEQDVFPAQSAEIRQKFATRTQQRGVRGTRLCPPRRSGQKFATQPQQRGVRGTRLCLPSASGQIFAARTQQRGVRELNI